MPRRAVQATTRRGDLRLSPELGEAQRRTDGSNRSRPPAPEDRRLKIRSSPSMQAPWSPRRGRELSRASLGEARRRQSRTGHGRTRHEGRPPGPPAYPPLSSRRSLWRRRHFEAEAIFDHEGRIAPPTPGALCSRSEVACQEGRQHFIVRRRIRRSRAAERTAAIRAERPLRPAHPQKETGTSAASTSSFETPVASKPSGKGGRASSSRSRKCDGRSAMRRIPTPTPDLSLHSCGERRRWTPFSRAEISEEQVRCSRGGPRAPGPLSPPFCGER